jgi:hypothetical protein
VTAAAPSLEKRRQVVLASVALQRFAFWADIGSVAQALDQASGLGSAAGAALSRASAVWPARGRAVPTGSGLAAAFAFARRTLPLVAALIAWWHAGRR